MCGRFILTKPADVIASVFDAPGVPPLAPRYNVAPGQPILAIRRAARGEGRVGTHFLWGLVPSWATDPSIARRLINARSETVAEKPSFRAAFRRRRCLVPADGYYEWAATGGPRKQPYCIRQPGEGLFALAGLFEEWIGADGTELATCALLTTSPAESVAFIHDRMPVILDPGQWDRWLDPSTPPADLAATLGPWEGPLVATPVSVRVNDARREGPELLEPLVEP